MRKQLLCKVWIVCACIFLGSFFTSCSDDDVSPPEPDREKVNVWSETMAGNDMEEIAWPDQSENYWEYTFDVTANPNVGLRFQGEYPRENARFFNLTFYNDNTTRRITSIEDFNIEPNKDSANPFSTEGVSGENFFEVNIVPEGTASGVKSGLSNVLEFPSTTEKLSVLLRIYFNTTDHGTDFGGVELPEVLFIDTTTGKEIGPATRAQSQYYTMCQLITKSIPVIQTQKAMVFTLAPDVMYSNGPTGYVTSANRLTPDSVLLFRFIPPVYPKSITDSRAADVRYWSICVGDTLTHTPITIPDTQITLSDDGYANFMVIEKRTPMYDAVVAKAKGMKINVITWDALAYGEPLMVFYRQMYIRSDYEYSVKKVPSYPPLNAMGLPDSSAPIKDENMAHNTLGEHGPSGLKLPAEFVLSDYFSYDYMRIPKQ